MKKQKSTNESVFNNNHFDYLSEEIVFVILNGLDENPINNKSFYLVCKSFYAIESRHRKTLKPLRSEHLTKVLNRYPNMTHLDLCLCPRITDTSLSIISTACNETLRSIDLSRSKFFSHLGLSNLATNCSNLIKIDLSNTTELGRCKLITDIGIGCIAVGCRKLRLINLKWCLGVGDLGVGLGVDFGSLLLASNSILLFLEDLSMVFDCYVFILRWSTEGSTSQCKIFTKFCLKWSFGRTSGWWSGGPHSTAIDSKLVKAVRYLQFGEISWVFSI